MGWISCYKNDKYKDSSTCFRINTWYWLSYMYFIVLEVANIPTNKFGRHSTGALMESGLFHEWWWYNTCHEDDIIVHLAVPWQVQIIWRAMMTVIMVGNTAYRVRHCQCYKSMAHGNNHPKAYDVSLVHTLSTLSH